MKNNLQLLKNWEFFLTLASVVVADFVWSAILARLASLNAHPIDANSLGSTLFATAADGLTNALDENKNKNK